MDKLKLDCLLFSFAMKEHWLWRFSEYASNSALCYGPMWRSMNRRYELASYCYLHWYYACSQEERTEFHRIQSLKLSRQYPKRG